MRSMKFSLQRFMENSMIFRKQFTKNSTYDFVPKGIKFACIGISVNSNSLFHWFSLPNGPDFYVVK